MKPFEETTKALQSTNGLVKRSTFLRILRRIAELSGVQLAPLSRAGETASGASYALSADVARKSWGVSFVGAGRVRVGAGCVAVQGRIGSEVLSRDVLAVGAVGYVGVSVEIIFQIGAKNDSIHQRAEWLGWVTASKPELAFKSTPPDSFAEINYASVESQSKEVFVPIAYIENGAVVDLIRDGIVIKATDATAFPQPIYRLQLV